MRRTRLKPMSDKRRDLSIQRARFVMEILLDRPLCEFPGCKEGSVDVHEPLMRSRGGSILDPDNAKACCRAHHDWVHLNPAAATELGWLVSRYPGRRDDDAG